MAIINCPSCGKRISSVTTTCQFCKTEFDDSMDDEKLMREMRSKRFAKTRRLQNSSFLSVLLFATGAIVMYYGITDASEVVNYAGRLMLAIGFIGYISTRLMMFMSRKR